MIWVFLVCAFSPRENQGKRQIAQHTMQFTNQRSCPDSVHVLYLSIEFLTANCQSQTSLLCWEAEFPAHSENLKVMNMSRTRLLLVSTLVFVFVSGTVRAKSDYLTQKWHPNKMCTRFLCLSCGSVKQFLLLQIRLIEKWYCCLRALISFLYFFKRIFKRKQDEFVMRIIFKLQFTLSEYLVFMFI